MGLMERCWEDVDCKFRWEDNIKMSPKDRIQEGVDCRLRWENNTTMGRR